MLCYRCGSYNSDGSKKCTVCSAALAAPRRPGKAAPTSRRAARGKLPVEPGTIIGERYRVVDAIAQGAAGWVVRARDEEVDVDVALKLIAPNLLQADDERSRFIKLIKTAKKLHHPNVVRIYDEGEQGSTVYYTMPFLEGLTLRKIIDLRVERGQIFGFAETLPIAAQLASAIDGWQKIGVHGALRPHNIVVLPDVLKVTGLAHQRGIPSRPFLALHQQQRTIDYIAPEVRRDDGELSAATDTYALTIMLGEMLVGRLQSTDTAAWVDAASKLPTAVVEVLRKGASELPADRYESGAALFGALATAMSTSTPDLAVPGLTALPAFANELFDDVSEPATISEEAPTVADVEPVELVSMKEMSTTGGPAQAAAMPPPPAPMEPADTEVTSAVPLASAVSVSLPAAEVPRRSEGSSSKSKELADRSSAKPLADARPRPSPVVDEPSHVGPARAFGKHRPPKVDTARIAARPRDRHLRARRQRVSGIMVIVITLLVAVAAVAAARWYGTLHPGAPEEPKQDVTPTAMAEPAGPPEQAPVPAGVNAVPSAPVASMGTPRMHEPPPDETSTADALRRIAALGTHEPPPPDPTPPPLAMPSPPKPPMTSAPPANEESPPAVVHASCPQGMISIKAGRFVSGSDTNDPMRGFGDQSAHTESTGSYCIDVYEYPNQRGREPVAGYTWARAKKACEGLGKRLCSEDEWERACKGPAGAKFPFGGSFEQGACNVGEGGRPAASGEFGRCRSGYGVADMSGNVSEWTASRMGDGKVVKGGSVEQAAFTARCSARAAESASAHTDTLGFRCCADLE